MLEFTTVVVANAARLAAEAAAAAQKALAEAEKKDLEDADWTPKTRVIVKLLVKDRSIFDTMTPVFPGITHRNPLFHRNLVTAIIEDAATAEIRAR